MESLKDLRMHQIIELLSLLSELDISCKSDTSVPDQMRFELFILTFMKKGSYAGN